MHIASVLLYELSDEFISEKYFLSGKENILEKHVTKTLRTFLRRKSLIVGEEINRVIHIDYAYGEIAIRRYIRKAKLCPASAEYTISTILETLGKYSRRKKTREFFIHVRRFISLFCELQKPG